MNDRYFGLKNLLGAILLLTVLVWGCQKDDRTLGINLLPGIKVLVTRYNLEKTSLTSAILTDTKIRVDRPTYNLLGSFNDPLFGRTDAGFAAQFRLPYHPAYSATSKIDSIILNMTYKKIYGDTLSLQTVQVYELTGSLNYNAKYLSSFDIKSLASTEPIGIASFIPKFRTDTLTPQDTTLQTIRVRLNNSFGTKLLSIDSLQMISNDDFLNIFKGLYIAPNPLDRRGTLMSLNVKSSLIALYYHDAKKDTLSFAYMVSANSANVSEYVHDYTTSRFSTFLDQEHNPDTLIYVQPTGGIKSKIMVPSFSNWKDSVNYAINKATLTFHVDTIMSDNRRYPIPARLYLLVPDSTGVEVFPADSKLSSSYYGGFYDALSATYAFNVTQHLQQLIKGTIQNNGLYLVHSDRIGTGQRVVLKGPGSTHPIELSVSYTHYK